MTLAHFKNEGKNNNIQMSTKSNIPENVGMNSVLNHIRMDVFNIAMQLYTYYNQYNVFYYNKEASI